MYYLSAFLSLVSPKFDIFHVVCVAWLRSNVENPPLVLMIDSRFAGKVGGLTKKLNEMKINIKKTFSYVNGSNVKKSV